MFCEIRLPADSVQSLAWAGDSLVDLAGGQQVFHLDGTSTPPLYSGFGPGFDGICAAPDGRHCVVYQRTGTKGLLLCDGVLVRELNRSFYHAHAYEYPLAFVSLPDSNLALVHCPDSYCQLEIESVARGERLTRGAREPADYFHSRLCANPSGTRLLSAGWIWHPFHLVVFFDVLKALSDVSELDQLSPVSLDQGVRDSSIGESSACWLDDHRVVLACWDEELAADGGQPNKLAVFDLRSNALLSSVGMSERVGTLMAVGANHVVSFYQEPKIVSLKTGEILHRWTGLFSGIEVDSIIGYPKIKSPPMALDPAGRRFAVATDQEIVVVQFSQDHSF